MKSNTPLWALIGLLLAAICAVAVYRAWPLLFPEVSRSLPADPACDLRAGPCISKFDDGASVSLVIEPRDIPLVKPLQIQVRLKGLEAEGVEVDFSGTDMNMGFNRFRLEQKSDGVFSGDGILPVCVRDSMEWEARVLITTRQGLLSAAYRFITVRSGLPLPSRNK